MSSYLLFIKINGLAGDVCESFHEAAAQARVRARGELGSREGEGPDPAARDTHHRTTSGDEREGESRGQAGKEPASIQARSSLALLGQITRLAFGELA